MAMLFVTHSDEEAIVKDRVVLKGRPSKIEETIKVDLPRPRSRAT
jgi:ABC-type nitrate/sulfonate/bicarbonate transport system ATPase subunit